MEYTVQDIIDSMDNWYAFDELVAEQFWRDINMKKVFERMVRIKCDRYNVKIDEDFDFDEAWNNIYETTEKGLS